MLLSGLAPDRGNHFINCILCFYISYLNLLTTCILVQPEVLAFFFEKKGQQARGSGLLARFIFSSGETTQGTRFMEYDIQEPSWKYLNLFNKLIF